MFNQNVVFLSANSQDAMIGHGITQTEVGQNEPQGQTGGFFDGGIVSMLLIYVALFGVIWFFMIRPQKNRQKKIQELQSSLKVGDNIVTNSGMFGKIVDIGEDVFIIEFGTIKGIRIPVVKTEVLAIKEPSLSVSSPVKE